MSRLLPDGESPSSAGFDAGRQSLERDADHTGFVTEELKAPSSWEELKGQIYLEDERFVMKMQARLARQTANMNIPRAQRRGRAPSLARIAKAHPDRNRAILAAHDTGEYSYAQIAQHVGVHFTTVGRIVRAGRSFRRKVKD